jgi:hypothetical protein
MTGDPKDLTATDILATTLVREGKAARTPEELARFGEEVGRRPIRQLLDDLPGLARLDPDKFEIVLRIIRSRMQKQPFAVRERMAAMIRIHARGTGNRLVAERLSELADPSAGR